MIIGYLVYDYVENHPSCVNGAPYWKSSALLVDRPEADRWAAGNTDDRQSHPSIVIPMEYTVAREMHEVRRLTLEEAEFLLSEEAA